MTQEERLTNIEGRLTAIEEKIKEPTIELDGRAVYEAIMRHERYFKERGIEWLQN